MVTRRAGAEIGVLRGELRPFPKRGNMYLAMRKEHCRSDAHQDKMPFAHRSLSSLPPSLFFHSKTSPSNTAIFLQPAFETQLSARLIKTTPASKTLCRFLSSSQHSSTSLSSLPSLGPPRVMLGPILRTPGQLNASCIDVRPQTQVCSENKVGHPFRPAPW